MRISIKHLLCGTFLAAIIVFAVDRSTYEVAELSITAIEDLPESSRCLVGLKIIEQKSGRIFLGDAVAQKSTNKLMRQHLGEAVDLDLCVQLRYRARSFLPLKPQNIVDLISPHFHRFDITLEFDPATGITKHINQEGLGVK